MICPKFVVLNPLKDRPVVNPQVQIRSHCLTESEPFSDEKCQWQKGRLNYFLKGFSKILMIPLVSVKCDMSIDLAFFSV